ncbi:TylF/MycF/NovP-related O-methyltransferase [Bartonella tribocorum]|uniref:Uncharacterized protein n=1 Tax=Bartonella tribocorum TaxID=85701 RepID=A0A2M6UQN2_9HYPH|nr:TylF/MycF/NovP-related O-methyltransferase [Bartonella tribocorum]PIT68483.1 hypothetical protein CER18_06950 [Bartonella tribocorum]
MNKIIRTALLLCTVMVTAGFVIIDEGQLPRCQKALDAFRVQERSKNPISSADEKAGVVFWCK